MKRIIAAAAALIMMLCMLCGATAAEDKELHIVATIFPVCDWVREISAGIPGVRITQLLDNGVDLHSFQPTAQDIRNVTEADLFLFVGGESDDWVEDVARAIPNPEWRTVNLLEALGDAVKAEETVEGMEPEKEAHREEENGEEADEHVWLSLRNARMLCGTLAEALAEADPNHAEKYRKNAETYGEKLDALDRAYTEAVSQAAYHTLLFGDRFPFRYLTEDYGLEYYAAFSGCSAESEASFQTIVFLAQKLDELGLPAVITIDQSGTRIAETVVSATREKNQEILSLDSMQGTTSRDAEAGATYLKVMEQNLEVLKQALN